MGVRKQSNAEQVVRMIRKAINAGLDAQAQVIVDQAVANIGRGGDWPSSSSGMDVNPPGGFPKWRTGKLARSIAHDGKSGTNEAKDDSFVRRVGSTMGYGTGYAAIQEFGGVVRAKKGKYLTVPIGQLGHKYLRQYGNNMRSANLEFRKTKDGRAFLFVPSQMTKAGKVKKGTGIPVFRLIQSVRIPARPYLRPAANTTRAKQVAAFENAFRATIGADTTVPDARPGAGGAA